MDSTITRIGWQYGIPPDLIRIAICLILNFPLSYIIKSMDPSPSALYRKQLLIVAMGVFYLVGIFRLYWGLLILLLMSLFTYTVSIVIPAHSAMPWLNFGGCMCALMSIHVHEQFGGEDFVNNIGVSGSAMILVMKLSGFGWDIYDGKQPTKLLTEFQEKNRITTPPTLPAFLSWCFFFPSILTGPTCGFREYNAWLDRSLFKGQKKIPSGTRVAALKCAEGLIWAWLYFASIEYVTSEFLDSVTYQRLPFLGRVLYLWIISWVYQLKYIIGWTFSNAACIYAGLGYNGTRENGVVLWDRVCNVHPLRIFMAQNCYGYINNWNINTSKWLRNYVYLRVAAPGKRPGIKSTLATFIVSAFWHGTRPGYYLTFVIVSVMQIFGKVYRRKIRPVFNGTSYKFGYDVLTWVSTQAAFGFAVQPFVVQDFDKSLAIWWSVYFYVHVVLLVSWFFLVGPGISISRQVLRQIRKDVANHDA